MKYVLSLLCLLNISTGYASDFRHWSKWTTAEKVEYAAFTALNYTDFAQTKICVNQFPKCKEINPLFGSSPNDATLAAAFLLSQLGYYYVIGISEHNSYAKKSRFAIIPVKLAIVISNDSQGIKISKVW
jgi:hypothetical protein